MSDQAQDRYFEKLVQSTLEGRSSKLKREAEAQRLIEREVVRCGLITPPINFDKLANHLSAEIQYIPLSIRGQILVDHHSIVIQVSSRLNSFERRKTLAHELCHLILEQERLLMHKGSRVKTQYDHPRQVIERLCDQGSAELLCPSQWLQDSLRGVSLSLQLLTELAERIRCPTEFVFSRLKDLGLSEARLLRFRRGESSFRVVGSVPEADEGFLAQIDLLAPSEHLLARSFAEGAIQGQIHLRTPDGTFHYNSECLPLGNNEILTLLVITRNTV